MTDLKTVCFALQITRVLLTHAEVELKIPRYRFGIGITDPGLCRRLFKQLEAALNTKRTCITSISNNSNIQNYPMPGVTGQALRKTRNVEKSRQHLGQNDPRRQAGCCISSTATFRH